MKTGTPSFLREPENFQRVAQRSTDRLVDEEPLFCRDHWPRLREMRPAIDAFDQHAIHVAAQFFDRLARASRRICRAKSRCSLRRGSALDSMSGLNVLTSGHNLAAGDVSGVVASLRIRVKASAVRGIEADDADASNRPHWRPIVSAANKVTASDEWEELHWG